MKRKIPSVMVSQHPDNSSKPYWHTEAYINDQYEVKECYLAFSELGVSEYKWDWEGKFVEESVFERLISEYSTFFQKNPLGKEKFLTFRLPDFRVETEFRLSRSFMTILSADGLAKKVGLHTPPIFEVILPMTQSAEEMISIQEAFNEIASLRHKLHIRNSGSMRHIEIIPLFESLETIINADGILDTYINMHKKFGFLPDYVRPYFARSDSALSSGIVPSVLSIKIGLSRLRKFEEKRGLEIYPIIGAGSLPFRGGSTPYTIPQFASEYKGIRTMLVQSAFQYDFPIADVKSAIDQINKLLNNESILLSPSEEKAIISLIPLFETPYKNTVKKIGPTIYTMAGFLPPRRERLKHTGLLKYPRRIGGIKIPRAIGFTASLYSLGIPPELIGTGRGIKKAQELGKLPLVEKYYLYFRSDLERAGKYLNKKVLKKLAERSNAFCPILEDIEEVEKYLGHELSPESAEEKAHAVFTSEIYEKFTNSIEIKELIAQAAILRKSLG